MAHAVQDDLGDGTAALDWLKAGLVIDGLRQAQQRAAPIERVRG